MDPVSLRSYLMNLTPMLAVPNKMDITSLGSNWMFDQKLDGIRAIMAWDGMDLTIRNRSGRDITHRYPELVLAAPGILGTTPVVIDGEIVASTGKFQDIANRDHQNKPEKIAALVQSIPALFVAFDVLWYDVDDTRDLDYYARRSVLEMVAKSWSPPFEVSVVSNHHSLFDAIKKAGGEGVIAKHIRSRYLTGRAQAWIKYKAVHTVTCLATGYDAGNGSRADFGALYISLWDSQDVTLVPVGRVGSGFSKRDIEQLKSALDGQPAKSILVDVECLNVSRASRALRFPVFKGIRTDLELDIRNINISQLDSIPRT